MKRNRFTDEQIIGILKERQRSADSVRLEVPRHKGFDFGYRPALSNAA